MFGIVFSRLPKLPKADVSRINFLDILVKFYQNRLRPLDFPLLRAKMSILDLF